ncbi:protein kinase 2, partial [Reticulomyxa filosa]
MIWILNFFDKPSFYVNVFFFLFKKKKKVKKKDEDDLFAMKILKKKALIAKQQVEHTNAERSILRSMDHPFLMHLRYAFQTDSKLYFVLDYYRGGELFFHLKTVKRFSLEQARFFVAEVGMALGHLHSFDIIYRDLKPENILLDQAGHACLTDFGLSKELTDGEKAT